MTTQKRPKRLSNDSITRLARPTRAQKRRHYASGHHPRLELRLYPTGKKSWVYRYPNPEQQKVRVVIGAYAPDGDDTFDVEDLSGRQSLTIAGALAAVVLLEQRRLGGLPFRKGQANPTSPRGAGRDRTFGALLEAYLERKSHKASIRSDEAIIRRYLQPSDAGPLDAVRRRVWHADVGDVDVDDLVKLFNASRRGVRRKMAVILRATYAYALQLGWFSSVNPITTTTEDSNRLGLFMLPPEEPHDAVLSKAQWAAILEELEMAPHRTWNEAGYLAPWIATAMKLLMATGLRRQEVLLARWADLESTPAGTPVLRVPRHKNSRKARRKGGDGSKRVPLQPATVAILGAWRGEVGAAACDYICQTDKGRGVNGDYLSKCWDKMMHRLGINRAGQARKDRVTVHSIRHTLCTHAADDGVPLKTLAKLLGSSEATLERYYRKGRGDAELDRLAAEAAALDSLMTGTRRASLFVVSGA